MNKFAAILPRVRSASRRLVKAPRAAFATLGALAGSAMAEVPAEVTTAVTGIKTDATSVATLVLLAVVAIFAIKFIRKGL